MSTEVTGTGEELTGILDGFYWCGRVWEAWQYKTMTEEDFEDAAQTALPGTLIAWRDAAVRRARRDARQDALLSIRALLNEMHDDWGEVDPLKMRDALAEAVRDELGADR